jgi:hypothetical protein
MLNCTPSRQEATDEKEVKPKEPTLPAESSAKNGDVVTEDDQARELLNKVAAAETAKKSGGKKEQDEYEALAARFEALKKR